MNYERPYYKDIKYWRPDVSIENIPKSEENKAVRISNQMIFYSVQGMLFN